MVEKQLVDLKGLLDKLEESFQSCLELGRSLLLALGQCCPELRLGDPQALLVARKVDANLESLRRGYHVIKGGLEATIAWFRGVLGGLTLSNMVSGRWEPCARLYIMDTAVPRT